MTAVPFVPAQVSFSILKFHCKDTIFLHVSDKSCQHIYMDRLF